jgi:hypothetical protein
MRRLLVAVSVVAVAACAPLYPAAPTPPQESTPATAPTSPVVPAGTAPADGLTALAPVGGVTVLPASSHVTGLPYPSACTVRKAVNGDSLPDPTCNPGAASSATTQDNINSTICVSGYTAKIRPPVSETGPAKKAAMRAYGELSSQSRTTEYDHLVPLELGGSNSILNLWPEPSDLPGQGFRNKKDTVENDLKAAVCGGRVKLALAQNLIASDWTTAEHGAGLN